MKLFHLQRTNNYINLDAIAQVTPSFDQLGDYFVSMIEGSPLVINTAELADILQHIGVVNAPKPMPYRYQVGDKVRYALREGVATIIEEHMSIVNSNDQIVTFQYDNDAREWVRDTSKLTLVESVTQVTPDDDDWDNFVNRNEPSLLDVVKALVEVSQEEPEQADWSKLPKFQVGDLVTDGFSTGHIASIDADVATINYIHVLDGNVTKSLYITDLRHAD